MWKTPSNVPWMSTAKTRTQPLPPRRMPEPTHVAVLLAGQLCQVHGDIAGWRGDDDAPGDSSPGGLPYFP